MGYEPKYPSLSVVGFKRRMMARELRGSSSAAGREALREGETGEAGNGSLPEFLPEVEGVLAETDPNEG